MKTSLLCILLATVFTLAPFQVTGQMNEANLRKEMGRDRGNRQVSLGGTTDMDGTDETDVETDATMTVQAENSRRAAVNRSGATPAPATLTKAPTSTTKATTKPTKVPVTTTKSPIVLTKAPIKPTIKPTRAPFSNKPTKAPIKPTRAPVSNKPTKAPIKPTRAPVSNKPTKAPIKPTRAPVSNKPTKAPIKPTKAPVSPSTVPFSVLSFTPVTVPTETPTLRAKPTTPTKPRVLTFLPTPSPRDTGRTCPTPQSPVWQALAEANPSLMKKCFSDADCADYKPEDGPACCSHPFCVCATIYEGYQKEFQCMSF